MSTAANALVSRLGAREAAKRTLSPSRFLLGLLTLGMIAAFIEVASFQSSLEAQEVANPGFSAVEIIKTPLFYRAYAVQLVCGLFAGMLGIIALNFRTIDRTYLMRFWFLIGAALLMTARGYTVADLLSMRLADSTGPIPFFLFVLVFVGANRNNWRALSKVFTVEAVILSCFVLFGIFKLRTFSRDESVIMLANFLNILLWPAAFVALSSYEGSPFLCRFRFLPILIYALGSVFTQTRLNFVMLLTLLFLYAYVQRKRGVPQSASWILWTFAIIWVCLFTAIFLRDSSAFQHLNDVAGAFYSRLDEDTRTGQLTAFALDVRPSELLLGRGSFATWKWGSMLWKGGTDVGYLSLLLYGGLPLLVAYIGAQVVPSLRLFRRHIEDWQVPAAAVVFMFAVRMFSSSYPGENLESYVLLLCTGACIACSAPPASQRVAHVTRYRA